jgi:pyruvate dehydrogenase E1 component alpha subunit
MVAIEYEFKLNHVEEHAKTILDNIYATEAEFKAIDDKITTIVEGSVKFAEESPWPDDSEVLKDVYIDQSYPFIVD